MTKELFTLSSDDFENKCREAFSGWWKDKEFADVTIATEDGDQISVHKLVLSSSSQLFKSLLSKNPHPHPLIYLTGVSMNNLQSVLEYVYSGQCNMQQDDLDGFLKIGEELLIRGLTQDFDTKLEPGVNDLDQKTESEKDDIHNEDNNKINFPVSAATNKESVFPCNSCEYSTRYQHNLTKHFNAKHTEIKHDCNFCEYKSSWKQRLKDHIESIHGNGKSKSRISCNICDFKAANSSSLRVHKLNLHEGKRYYCDKCDYKAAHSMNLRFHIQIVHEGIRYECNECDYKSTKKWYLKNHTESVHKGVTYNCNECDFKVTTKRGMKRHMQNQHKRLELVIQN